MASSASIQPPVGGWDTESALADMPPENAIVLDNWFPDTDDVQLRRGFAEHATGMTGEVGSLMEYIPTTGTGELFAGNGTSIFDVSSAGAVGAAVVTGMSNARWQHTQISTSAGHFLFAVNGADTPRTYNGTTWAAASVTGPTAANLIWTNNHQRRLWFGEEQSMSAWYFPVNTISGTAQEFPMGALAKRGGYIMAMGTWTRDGGDGADDVAVFLTSEGQAILFVGVDPSSSSTWDLIGVFDIGKPIGRRCMIKAGADLIMITQDGFVAASSILQADRSQTERVAISRQINRAVNDAARSFGTNFGWEPFIYPKGQMLIFNVPISGTQSHQYVFNTITNKPCRFTGIDAVCWGILNDNAYFGGLDGKVYLFDTGNADNGTNIEGNATQAFNYLGSRAREKRFSRVECLFQSGGNPNASIDMNVDFSIKSAPLNSVASPSTDAKWGIAKWGIDKWSSASQVYRGWRAVRGNGRAASIRVRVSSGTARPSWVASNIIYTNGGPK